MLGQHDLEIYRQLDGQKHSFFLLNVDIHNHSELLANGKPHDVGVFYKLSARFFELAVELNHGLIAPWQGDGGFAIFDTASTDGFKNTWNAASDFMVPYQSQVLRNLLYQIEADSHPQWQKNYPKFYCLMDKVEFVFDFNSPGNWCGYGLSYSLKKFKEMAKPNKVAITKSAHKDCDANFWKCKGLKPPKQEEVYLTTSLGPDLIISNPLYRDRIYKQQAQNIGARNTLTEFVIENGFIPKQFLITALHCLAKVFHQRDDVKPGSFRASVWRKSGAFLEFEWGYPSPEIFGVTRLPSKVKRFKLGEGCAGEVWKTGKPILLPRATSDKRFVRLHENHADESAAFYPILPKERCKMSGKYSPDDLIGVLCLGVAKQSEFKFKTEDEDIIETYIAPFSLNIALAISLLGRNKNIKSKRISLEIPAGKH